MPLFHWIFSWICTTSGRRVTLSADRIPEVFRESLLCLRKRLGWPSNHWRSGLSLAETVVTKACSAGDERSDLRTADLLSRTPRLSTTSVPDKEAWRKKVKGNVRKVVFRRHFSSAFLSCGQLQRRILFSTQTYIPEALAQCLISSKHSGCIQGRFLESGCHHN